MIDILILHVVVRKKFYCIPRLLLNDSLSRSTRMRRAQKTNTAPTRALFTYSNQAILVVVLYAVT